jgi:hypothetical protein
MDVPPSPLVRSIDEQIRDAEQNLSRQLEWAARADAKASFVIGLQTAMIGVLAATATRPSTWTLPLIVLFGTAVIFLIIAFCYIYMATFPALSGPPESLIFFGRIAELPPVEFFGRFLVASKSDHLADLLRQSHQNALIANNKYRCVKAAYAMLFLSAVPWALLIYIFGTRAR